MSDPHDIARAMMALPGWRWPLDGGARFVRVASDGSVTGSGLVVGASDLGVTVYEHGRLANLPPAFGGLPDLSHGPTLGWVEHGLLAPAGVWIWRSSTVLVGGKPAVMACEGMAKARGLGPPHDNLPAALLDGLRAVRP